MKRILISLSIVAAAAAIIIGGTTAFFSDTETSAGNVFTAGSIDLKVDHKFASYNGNPCTQDCVELPQNLILNGSFEVPEVTNAANWQIFPNGTPNLEWTVEWETGQSTSYQTQTRPEPALTEYHENVLGPAQSGDQYAELDSDWFGPNNSLNGEPALTKIYQNVATTPGAKYTLHYWYSPRPNVAAANNVLLVRVDGTQVAMQQAAGGGTTSWTEYTYTFNASGATTKIEFAGAGTADSLGTFLDNVSLHPYDCSYVLIGGTCTLWDEKDLGDGDFFWNFGDVKPGDYGVNVISLHPYTNDAYACVYANDIDDQENSLLSPEIAAGDAGQPLGELSGFIRIFAWNDLNANGLFDGAETQILAPNSPFASMIGVLNLPSNATENLGIAWCAGTQSVDGGGVISCDGSTMGNIAQTDSVTAAITAYAVQQRNNGDFDCEDIEYVLTHPQDN